MKKNPMFCQTLQILRTIGSPFVSESELPSSREELSDLLSFASKNGIELLFLQKLREKGALIGFRKEYERLRNVQLEQIETIKRISRLLDSIQANYAVFKTLEEYPATHRDVDILIFESEENYRKIVKTTLDTTFVQVGPEAPFQFMLHDSRKVSHPHKYPGLLTKDPFDVDLYLEVGISHIVYLEKEKVKPYVRNRYFSDGSRVKTLSSEAELAVLLIHSVLSERKYSLATYYSILCHLARLQPFEVVSFIDIVRENSITLAAGVLISITAELHQTAHGFLPEMLRILVSNLGNKTHEARILRNRMFEMPHRYSWLTILRTLLEKVKDDKARRSMARQVIEMMIPSFLKYAAKHH